MTLVEQTRTKKEKPSIAIDIGVVRLVLQTDLKRYSPLI